MREIILKPRDCEIFYEKKIILEKCLSLEKVSRKKDKIISQ